MLLATIKIFLLAFPNRERKKKYLELEAKASLHPLLGDYSQAESQQTEEGAHPYTFLNHLFCIAMYSLHSPLPYFPIPAHKLSAYSVPLNDKSSQTMRESFPQFPSASLAVAVPRKQGSRCTNLLQAAATSA